MPFLTDRTKLGRHPERGTYDRDDIYRILDEAFICHVGFVSEGQPFVIPTAYGRSGDILFIHGSAVSRMLRHLEKSVPVCVTVTLLDGLVLAHSAFNHSMNYRSVLVLGAASLVDDPEQKLSALNVISEHIIPGRWAEARKPTQSELKATAVLQLPLNEASAKIRTGPPKYEKDESTNPVWTGVLPIEQIPGEPQPCPAAADIDIPAYVKNYSRTPRTS